MSRARSLLFSVFIFPRRDKARLEFTEERKVTTPAALYRLRRDSSDVSLLLIDQSTFDTGFRIGSLLAHPITRGPFRLLTVPDGA